MLGASVVGYDSTVKADPQTVGPNPTSVIATWFCMQLFKTSKHVIVEDGGRARALAGADWDQFFECEDAAALARDMTATQSTPVEEDTWRAEVQAPIGGQEVWAAGVTYYRSRDARMEESADAGGGDFYARVYAADRPELFFKATAHRVAGTRQPVRIRHDSRWNVPEPELTLAINVRGRIFGYTIGNDMSSRDIEGENPLYLPQAKTYNQCCGLGPGIYLSRRPLEESTRIDMQIRRQERTAFSGSTTLSQLKRKPTELVEYLFRENSFPRGCFLMTGTGIVPDPGFTLHPGDEIDIQIDPIGSLSNVVELATGSSDRA